MCEYGNQVVVKLEQGWLPEREQRDVSIDKCIVDIMKYLWKRRFQTLGCCCGHGGELPRSIVVGDGLSYDRVANLAQALREVDPDNNWEIYQWQRVTVMESNPPLDSQE